MRNLALSGLLHEVAVLLELKGENPFRVRAYRRAADAVALLSEDIGEVAAAGRLDTIKGVGKGIGAAIEEWLATGEMTIHRQLLEEIPRGVLELLRLPGVGPRTAVVLYQEAGVDSLDALRKALAEGRLDGVKGVGPKTREALQKALEALAEEQGRIPFGVAWPAAQQLCRALREHPAAVRVEIAGSLRRGRDMVGDVDLVAATDDPDALMAHFVEMPGVEQVEQRGSTRSRVRLYNGVAVDLRCVPPPAFPAAWHHLTGSAAHNVRLREYAQRQGWSVNEYGLTRRSDGTVVQPASEEELYRLLGLPYIPPELREDRGELEAALRGELPRLVTDADLKGDLHVHSTWSDGRLTLEEIAAEARRRGWRYVAIADHSPSLRIANGLDPERLRLQGKAIDALQEAYPDVRILKGVEVDILADGSLDLPDEVLAALDIVVASVHTRFQQDEEEMTRRIVRAMENPHVDILAHPTGRLLGRRDPYPVRIEEVIAAAVRTGVALEINSHPDRLDLKDEHVRMAVEAGALIAINSDMHQLMEFDHLTFGVRVARRGWTTAASVINTWDWPALEAWLRRER